MKTAIVDYGTGNLYSLANAFSFCGMKAQITNDCNQISRADILVLPGVGAYGECMQRLRSMKIDQALKTAVKSGKPILGICLGMQLLLEESEEFGKHVGLGLIPGQVRYFRSFEGFDQKQKVPLVGWNAIDARRPDPLISDLPGQDMYFVHSLCVHASDPDDTIATASYGNIEFSAVIRRYNIYGCQFHPEKSSKNGLKIIRNFINICEEKVNE